VNGARRVVVLLSGGYKSATLAFERRKAGDDVLLLTFDYGQRCREAELAAAKDVAALLESDHVVVPFDLLTRIASLRTKDDRWTFLDPELEASRVRQDVLPAFPLLAIAAVAWADSARRASVYLGSRVGESPVNHSPLGVNLMHSIARTSLASGVDVIAPYIQTIPGEIVEKARQVGAYPHLRVTHSCYGPRRGGCGVCEGCKWRATSFKRATLPDPLSADEKAVAAATEPKPAKKR